MPRESQYNADKLRKMITEKANANDICQSFGINKATLNNYLLKLMKADKSFYEIQGMDERIITPRVTKLGFKISLSKMKAYGFEEGDEILIQKQDNGSVLIKKK